MRTRANFKSHPVHPALVPYPIAFLHGAFICDVAGRLTGRRRWWRAGRALGVAGIAGALVAAVPGFIDYLFSVPPKSSGKRRATQHMLVNLGAVGLFSAAQWLRRGNRKPGLAALGAEAAGVGLLTSGAWMGGTLIHGNFIGPDHRYPESGRWSEEGFTAQPGETIAVARTGEFEAPGQMKLVRVNGRRIAIARTEDGYAAFDDHCTHRGGSLADGVMICDTVQCLWHGSQFDVHTGEVVSGPADRAIATYPLEVSGGEIRLTLAE